MFTSLFSSCFGVSRPSSTTSDTGPILPTDGDATPTSTSLSVPSTPDPHPACAFCHVNPVSFRIVHSDSNFIAFWDRSPAARIHLLAIPRRHVTNVKALTKEDTGMVRELDAFGRKALEMAKEQMRGGVDDHDTLQSGSGGGKAVDMEREQGEDRFGYHIPPFRSVDHLHLHLLSLPFRSTLLSLKYPIVPPSSPSSNPKPCKGWTWFITPDQLQCVLEKAGKVRIGPC